MEATWSHKQFEIQEGLKPGAEHFMYFFVVRENGAKCCRYCVWIEDDALTRLDPSGDWEAIIASHREEWARWVTDKLEARDFRDRVLRYDRQGKTEVDLSSLDEKLTLD